MPGVPSAPPGDCLWLHLLVSVSRGSRQGQEPQLEFRDQGSLPGVPSCRSDGKGTAATSVGARGLRGTSCGSSAGTKHSSGFGLQHIPLGRHLAEGGN